MDAWEERKKALENKYFHDLEQELIERIRMRTHEKLVRQYCRNRCPKCADPIEPIEFRGVPMDRCSGCGGVWLGPKDFRLLAEKDHRTWFDRWFKEKALELKE